MKVLALELSTTRGSLAWLDDGTSAVNREWPNDRKNSGPFFKNLADVAKKLGRPDTIIVGLGPGSYAGTRIAISAAIGLQASFGARLIGFPSICALDSEAHEYFVIGDARRKSFFFAHIRSNNLVAEPTLLSEVELRSKVGNIGSSTPVFTSDPLPQYERAVRRFPSASMLARLAQEPHRSFSLPPLEPIYLREPHITLPK